MKTSFVFVSNLYFIRFEQIEEIYIERKKSKNTFKTMSKINNISNCLWLECVSLMLNCSVIPKILFQL